MYGHDGLMYGADGSMYDLAGTDVRRLVTYPQTIPRLIHSPRFACFRPAIGVFVKNDGSMYGENGKLRRVMHGIFVREGGMMYAIFVKNHGSMHGGIVKDQLNLSRR